MIYSRIILSIIIVIANFFPSHGQTITGELGSATFPYVLNTMMHPDINDKMSGGSENYIRISYEQIVTKKIIISASLSRYPVSTYFNFYKENRGNGVGGSQTNVSRMDVSLMYNILNHSKFFISPHIGLGLQRSKPAGVTLGGNKEIVQSFIPNPDVRLLEDMEAKTFSNTQLVPVLGLKFGYAFWGRLELFMHVQQVFSHKTIQEERMIYSYKGIEQPDAITSADGTGRFWALGMGFRFVKTKK